MNFNSILDTDIILDDLPDDIIATIESRNKALQGLSGVDSSGRRYVIEHLFRWLPGQSIKVAFLDGKSDLHKDIENVIKEITDACNISLDFGYDSSSGEYRRWSETDTDYQSDIRISFDKKGYFSLVGNNSVQNTVGSPAGRVGGRPYQASMNFGGFAIHRPSTWKGTVLHEFMHALGFHHAHQNMYGPCSNEFRWEDDPGYILTEDGSGRFITDSAGKRPGIYTYLSGFPNFWSKSKVDHNLRSLDSSDLIISDFDRSSIMLYRFAPLFYKSVPSPCAPDTDGQSLSDKDKEGLKLIYPYDDSEANSIINMHSSVVSDLTSQVEGAKFTKNNYLTETLSKAMRKSLKEVTK